MTDFLIVKGVITGDTRSVGLISVILAEEHSREMFGKILSTMLRAGLEATLKATGLEPGEIDLQLLLLRDQQVIVAPARAVDLVQ